MDTWDDVKATLMVSGTMQTAVIFPSCFPEIRKLRAWQVNLYQLIDSSQIRAAVLITKRDDRGAAASLEYYYGWKNTQSSKTEQAKRDT